LRLTESGDLVESKLPVELLERVERCGVVAVLVVDELAHAVPLAEALVDGGIDVMELTLRTPVALEALKAICEQVPDMLPGAGTVLTPDQAREVAEAGAAFGVAPGLNPRVVRAAQEAGLPFAPGVATASDLEAALELGCREMKFFPAEPTGGMSYLKSLAAPYAHLGVRFVPLGGLKPDSVRDYLSSPLVLAVGGSWMAPREAVGRENWDAIRNSAAQARSIVNDVRGGGR
jgi:2-dehydro-3-deoxyphosphogluconate aldolase/(4S)-4-hydroxy-2-oxoglutarate aldolase